MAHVLGVLMKRDSRLPDIPAEIISPYLVCYDRSVLLTSMFRTAYNVQHMDGIRSSLSSNSRLVAPLDDPTPL